MLVLCRFVPQAWVGDYAMEVDALGPRTWTAEVPAIPTDPYDRDELRLGPHAPAWCSEWPGPFEVEVQAITEGVPIICECGARYQWLGGRRIGGWHGCDLCGPQPYDTEDKA